MAQRAPGRASHDLPISLALGLSVALLVGACSFSPWIESDTIDYSTTIEDFANTSLVTNVLRGRDGAPLYFPDLSQVRGSVTASVATQTTFPFGPRLGSTLRASAQGGPLTLSTNPTFDIAPTDTKQFYQGILNPLGKALFSYYIERSRGTSLSDITFHLLVSSIDVDNGSSLSTISWTNSKFVEVVDRWTRSGHDPVVVPRHDAPKPFGPPVPADAKAVVEASAAGLDVKKTTDEGKIQFVKKSSGSDICFFNGDGYIAVAIEEYSVTKAPAGAPIQNEQSSGGQSTSSCAKLKRSADTNRYTIRLRSVEQVFYYLGAIINPDADSWLLRQSGQLAGCPRIPFFVSQSPVEHVRFTVTYRGDVYYVADTKRKVECQSFGGGEPVRINDNTMAILAIVNELLNVNREASETPTTKAVQAVGGQ